MTKLTNQNDRPARPGFSTILGAWLLVGSLDICSAFLYSYIKNKEITPERVLHYIARTVLGKDCVTDPWILNVIGFLTHFIIALGWTILFFILYRSMKWMRQIPIVTGIVYGLFIWTMMNVLLLPWWNKKAFTFNPQSNIINALILILAIGIPLAFIAKRKSPAV